VDRFSIFPRKKSVGGEDFRNRTVRASFQQTRTNLCSTSDTDFKPFAFNHPTRLVGRAVNKSGSSAILAATRHASSLMSILAANDPRRTKGMDRRGLSGSRFSKLF
jgi:hypothetical protein